MTVYKYQGKDTEHYVGVPARDLTEEEFDALGPQEQFNVVEGSLYKAVGQPKGQRASRKAEPDHEPEQEPAPVADEQPAEPGGEG
jgi:hypothetical protein